MPFTKHLIHKLTNGFPRCVQFLKHLNMASCLGKSLKTNFASKSDEKLEAERIDLPLSNLASIHNSYMGFLRV